MKTLDRKLVRDLLQMKGQAVAIALVIACGVSTFVMSLSTLESLRQTQAGYYDRFRFAHVFAHLRRAPATLAERIAEIPGVAQVEPRIAVEVTLDVPGLDEPAIGRILSLPEMRPLRLNDVYLRRGRMPDPDRRGEVLASEAFVEAHQMLPGDRLRAVINGRLQELTIVGVALSPEFIYQIRPGDVLPDDQRFGVFWMPETGLAAAFDMEGAFNDVAVSLMRGASVPAVIERLDRLLDPYGGVGAYDREDQLSHRFLSDELTQLRGMALVAPTIFLAVAAFLLNVVLSRIISTQREQIAALKAFGYTNLEIGFHYLKFVLLIAVVGAVLGIFTGNLLARGLTELYSRFFRFPEFWFELPRYVAATGVLISCGAAVFGAFGAVRRAVTLPPAEAMRPEPPATFRATLAERLGLSALLSQPARMVLRQLERRPVKSLLSVFGIALSVAVLVLGNFGADAVDYLMRFQFEIAQQQDLTVGFVEPTQDDSLYELRNLPGVIAAEPLRSVSTRLRFGPRTRRVGVMGLQPQPRLYRVVDIDEQPVVLPPDGLVLSDKLAELLGVSVGDTVTVEVLEGKRPVRQIPVVATVAEFAGTNAYMNLAALQRLVGDGQTLTGGFLLVDGGALDVLYRTLKETPRVANVTVKEAALRSFQDTIAENLLRMKTFNVIFASIIAFGVIYNTARISLSERSRELATLRVIGFTRGEISAILLGELAVLTVAALPVGMMLGYGFAALATRALETEMFRIPLVVDRTTFAFAATVVLIASLLSGLVVRRRLDHLDLVSVLKSRE